MSAQAVARRYATALADVTLAHDEARKVQQELGVWAGLIEANPQLAAVFRNPVLAFDLKRKVLDALIARTAPRPTTANFLRVLLRNHRLADLPAINEGFARVLDERAGLLSAQVTTARPVDARTQEALRARLAQLTGRNVRLEFAVDEELLGGVVTRIGSTLYDGSVRTRLQRIKHQMAGE
ncbi:MAG TPA: ATP synthase F1 subunit delta [Pyrinomonadaceae bacterium]